MTIGFSKSAFLSFLLLIWSSVLLADGPQFSDKEIESALDKLEKEHSQVFENIDRDKIESLIKEGKDLEAAKILMDSDLPKKLLQGLQGNQVGEGVTDIPDDANYETTIRHLLAPLQSRSKDELRATLVGNLKEGPAKSYLLNNQNVFDLFVALIKDPEAMPKFASILDDKPTLYLFTGLSLATILIGWLIKRTQKIYNNIFGKVFQFATRMSIIYSLRFFLIYYFFGEQLTPFARLIREHL